MMVDAKKRLGRGLDSLLSATRLEELEQAVAVIPTQDRVTAGHSAGLGAIVEIPLDKITRNPYQPRKTWDRAGLFELAESIKANGLVQPVLVRPMGQGYQLIAGERRLRAMELAGKDTITAVVREASEEQVIEWALIENIHRSGLNALERAQAYRNYLERFSLTQQQAAERLGEDRSTIANYMRLLELSDDLLEMLAGGRLTMGHARALLAVREPAQRRRLAQMVESQNWSVRQLERQAHLLAVRKDGGAGRAVEKNPHIRELEQQIMESLGTKVSIKTNGPKGHRGRVVIEFYSLDDFDRIRERLC